MEHALAIMARYPEPGHVKSRLAARLGAAQACALYRAFLLDLRDRMKAASHAVVWACTPDDADLGDVVGATELVIPQGAGTLAERMLRVFERLLDSSATQAYSRVAMIGSDVPHVPLDWIERSFTLLDEADVVLGPAKDGGYYLIALRAPHDVFDGVPMGTGAVFAATCARAEALGLRIATLPTLFDIDVEEDLQRLRAHLAADPAITLQHTMIELESLEALQWKSS